MARSLFMVPFMARPGVAARLAADRSGAAMVEFALVAPIVFTGIFGVLQIGMAMQSYNAIRNVASDTARYALVEYQKGLEPSTADIRAEALDIADGAPYLLAVDRLAIAVDDAATQQVSGVKEMVVTVRYTIPTILPLPDYVAPQIIHSQPIFVLS